MQINAYFDGSCSDNPGGTMGIGCVIYNNVNEITFSKKIKPRLTNSNNVAEFEALYCLLKLLLENNLQEKSIKVNGDSQLIINIINGTYKVRDNKLTAYYSYIEKQLLPLFNHIEFEWIPRRYNKVADKLSTS
jgi:ribonuclease HI